MSRCCLTVMTALGVCLLSGCGPSKGQIESEVKKGMEAKLNAKVTALSLKESGKGKYVGTATTDRGDTFDVLVKVEGRSILAKWLPEKSVVEKQFRDMIEGQRPGQKVQSVTDLTMDGEGNYTGKAQLSTGETLNLTGRWQGEQYMFEVKP
jgi:hypothetical protein